MCGSPLKLIFSKEHIHFGTSESTLNYPAIFSPPSIQDLKKKIELFSDDFYANAACVCLIVVVLGFWVCFLRDYMALSVCQLVLLRVEGEWRGHDSLRDSLGTRRARWQLMMMLPDTRAYARACVFAYVFTLSVFMRVSSRACVCVWTLGHRCVCVLYYVYGIFALACIVLLWPPLVWQTMTLSCCASGECVRFRQLI